MSGYRFQEDMICPWDATATRQRIKDYREYYKVKYDIVFDIKPRTIVEIGVRAGYSAYYFMQASPMSVYYGFDADNKSHGGQGERPYIPWAKEILWKKGYDFRIYCPFDTQSTDELPVVGDFYHIDGDHTEKGVIHDLNLCFSGAPSGAYFLVDDYDYLEDVFLGVNKWIEQNMDFMEYEYVESMRGEILICKK